MEKISLRLKNFKCFKDNSFELNNLTVLTGANASGKSTIIQALLLVNSVMQSQVIDGCCQILLSEPERVLDLGTVDNILHVGEEDNATIWVNDAEFGFRIEDEVRRGNLLIHYPVPKEITVCPLSNLFYLNAERLGPRFERDMDKTRKSDCGNHGEFIPSVIENNNFTKVPSQRTLKGKENVNFRIALDSWMDYTFPEISTKVYATETTKSQVKINNTHLSVDNMTTKVGSGISHALPIIVTCLLAQINSFIIIENPEAHLHAKAQSNMGFFLGKMAAAGLRILLETHSEHIINGIRRAVVSQIGLKPEDVSIYFLENHKGGIRSQIIKIEDSANLSAFPVDFFDQQRQDSKAILDLISHKN